MLQHVLRSTADYVTAVVPSGVEVSSVDRLNLLQLAPGGHMGRFVIFTKSAFDRLDKIFGEYSSLGIHDDAVGCFTTAVGWFGLVVRVS